MSDEHVCKIFEMQDRLEELRHIANTAGMFAKNVTEEDNHPSFGNYINPKDWIVKDLQPFFRTVQYRLSDIHQMLRSTFEKCFEGCAFQEAENQVPTPEELAEKAERQEKNRQENQMHEALFDIRNYFQKGDSHRDVVLNFAKMLSTDPGKAAECVSVPANEGNQDSGAESRIEA